MSDDPHTAPVEELSSDYANNVRFEASVWDLKLIFGEYSNSAPQNVEWHTSITIPWAQAKLMLYYLEANVIAHEAQVNKINIPQAMIPPEWAVPPAEAPPSLHGIVPALKKLRERFLEDMGTAPK